MRTDSPELWDRLYRDGHWHYLGGIEQSARFGIIAAWIMALQERRTILDAGCGEGTLLRYLPADVRRDYTGIDFSSEAVARARTAWPDDDIEFVEADIEIALLDHVRGPSIVVCNECLYYLKGPAELIQALLERGAHVIFSNSALHPDITAMIRTAFAANLEELIFCSDDRRTKSWALGLLRSAN